MLIQYYLYKYNISDNIIFIKYNLYLTMFYSRRLHFINYLLFNILRNYLCADRFYIYFKLQFYPRRFISNYEPMIFNKISERQAHEIIRISFGGSIVIN